MIMDKLIEALDKTMAAKGSSIEPLKPLEAIPITHGAKAVKIDPDAKYLVFISAEDFNRMGENFINDPHNPLPAGTPIYIVDDIDNAVRIYQILDVKVNHA